MLGNTEGVALDQASDVIDYRLVSIVVPFDSV